MPTMPVLCLLCLYYAYYACTMPVLCLLCLYYAYYACTMPVYNYRVPKHLSDTRWDAHAKATEAILESYSAITNALNHLHSDVSEKGV